MAEFDSIFAAATCSAAGSYSLDVIIPVGTTGFVHVPIFPNSTKFVIKEGSSVVWKASYQPGDPGVVSGTMASDGRSVIFQVGSGSYFFTVLPIS